jgi:hypothetical protein
MRYKVFTAAKMWIIVFRVVTPCSLAGGGQEGHNSHVLIYSIKTLLKPACLRENPTLLLRIQEVSHKISPSDSFTEGIPSSKTNIPLHSHTRADGMNEPTAREVCAPSKCRCKIQEVRKILTA